MKKYAIGTDIGGSHISSVVVNLAEEKAIEESFAEEKVNNEGTTEEILASWKTAIQKSLSFINLKELAGIGFAMPGPFDYVNGIGKFTAAVAKYKNLYDVNIPRELKKIIRLPEDIEMRFLNDATGFAVGESWIGAAKNSNRMMAITLGTGFGSAFIEQGLPVLEGGSVPEYGCVWHLPYEQSIADDYFSTRWFVKRYREVTGEDIPGVKEITRQADLKNEVKYIFDDFGERLASFLTPLLIRFEAGSLVIGGNISGAYRLWGKTFETKIKENVPSLEIHLSRLGETAAMTGSARLLDEDYWVLVKPLLSKM